MGSDGRHTIPREEFVPGSQQLGEMGVRTLHPVVRITATNELAVLAADSVASIVG